MKRDIAIKTEDGTAKAGVFKSDGSCPAKAGVVLYMDAFGPRPAMDQMAERLAAEGYVVLVPDLFYRRRELRPLRCQDGFLRRKDAQRADGPDQGAPTQDMTRRDGAAFIDALDREGATGKIGTVGYCMGGGRAITAAAAYPNRVAAAASFHGGQLASDAPDSPHRSASNIKARVYVGKWRLRL